MTTKGTIHVFLTVTSVIAGAWAGAILAQIAWFMIPRPIDEQHIASDWLLITLFLVISPLIGAASGVMAWKRIWLPGLAAVWILAVLIVAVQILLVLFPIGVP